MPGSLLLCLPVWTDNRYTPVERERERDHFINPKRKFTHYGGSSSKMLVFAVRNQEKLVGH